MSFKEPDGSVESHPRERTASVSRQARVVSRSPTPPIIRRERHRRSRSSSPRFVPPIPMRSETLNRSHPIVRQSKTHTRVTYEATNQHRRKRSSSPPFKPPYSPGNLREPNTYNFQPSGHGRLRAHARRPDRRGHHFIPRSYRPGNEVDARPNFELPEKYNISVANLKASDNSDSFTEKPGHGGNDENASRKLDRMTLLDSKWVGGQAERGEISAMLSLTSGSPRGSRLNWYHIQQDTMNFDEFIAASQSLSCRSASDKRNVSKLLQDVKQKHEKQRQYGRDLASTCLVDEFYTKDDDEDREQLSVTFSSLSYLKKQAYNANLLEQLPPGSPLHPPRPLLQASYQAASYERELQQVVARHSNPRNTDCLHIAQIWCVVLNQDTLLTCSELERTEMLPNSINIVHVPPSTDSNNRDHPGINIACGSTRRWSLPMEPHLEWPMFLAALADSFEVAIQILDIRHRSKSINAQTWPAIVLAAHQTNLEIEVTTRTRPPYLLSNDADLPMLTVCRYFKADPNNPSKTSITEIATDLANTLQIDESSEESKLYKACEIASLSSINEWVRKQNQGKAPRTVQTKLAATVKHLFKFFWPTIAQHEMLCKYWGALKTIISAKCTPQTYDPAGCRIDDFLEDASDAMLQGFLVASSITTGLGASGETSFIVQPLLLIAWLHLMTGLLVMANDVTLPDGPPRFYSSTAWSHLDKMNDHLRQADRKLVKSIRSIDIDEHEMVQADGIAAFIMSNCCQDLNIKDEYVTTVYRDYFSKLKLLVTEECSERNHQQTLRHLNQEVEAIISVLESQLSITSTLRDVQIDHQGRDSTPTLSTADVDPPTLLLLEDTNAYIAARLDIFRSINDEAKLLAEWQLEQIDVMRDRQEAAIMVFTVITIIFLPMSFVSGVLGMNTSDIRDMPYQQWVYWAVSLPLTIVVLAGSLWWVGELRPTLARSWGWLTGSHRKQVLNKA